jgi:hypothetical protein
MGARGSCVGDSDSYSQEVAIISAAKQRALIWVGLGMMTCWFIAFAFVMGFFPPPSPALSAQEVAKIYSDHTIRIQIGVIIMICFGLFMVPMSLPISVQLAREEKGVPILAIQQGIAGAITGIMIALPAMFWAACAFSPNRDPELTKLMHELAFLFFVVPIFAQALQFIPVIWIALSKKVDESLTPFPRWIGYLCLWALLTIEVAPVAVIFKSGPFAWNGLFPFWLGLIIFGAYFNTQMFLILRALKRQEASEGDVALAPAVGGMSG